MNKNWKITGIVATVVIVMSFPLYVLKAVYVDGFGSEKVIATKAHYTGSKSCIDCHKIEYDQWLKSDHYFAMDTASDKSVLGDFNDVDYVRKGITHKFYKKDGKFYVHTEGTGGKMQDFEIKYTFGIWPLQQYLIPFPGGRLQTLPIAWDTIKKRWFHMADAVYPDEVLTPHNWLYWTNQAQNWNGMCAECHSTDLKKGFDPVTKTFHTTYSEISVGCEACHGPGSEHLKWAELPEGSRPSNTNYGLTVNTNIKENEPYVNLCAKCHARKTSLQDFVPGTGDLLNQIIPQLPREPLYFADGQIKEEDYVYGSFTQSMMYMNNIKCNDCHNVHTGRLLFRGNKLCLQCHRPDQYDTYAHHFHKQEGEPGQPVVTVFGDTMDVGSGARCINCHMDGRYYMGVDYRRDHSFRIPRPDLSDELHTPNACTQCHGDKSNKWAAAYYKKWYGMNNRASFGTKIAEVEASHKLSDTARYNRLADMSESELFPPILRARILQDLDDRYPWMVKPLLKENLSSHESLIRYTALAAYPIDNAEDIQILAGMLTDPVKAVRSQAAFKLSTVPRDQIPGKSLSAFNRALNEYKKEMEYSADFAPSRHNLGIFYDNLGQTDSAIENYRDAIRIDDQFYPAKVNLALDYNRLGENGKAEKLLKEVIASHPEQSGVKFSLGLLLSEMKKYDEALTWLEAAAKEIPYNPRIEYNLGQLLDFKGEKTRAEQALLKAREMDPQNPQYAIALIRFYLNHKMFVKAKSMALEYKKDFPADTSVDKILQFIDTQMRMN